MKKQIPNPPHRSCASPLSSHSGATTEQQRPEGLERVLACRSHLGGRGHDPGVADHCYPGLYRDHLEKELGIKFAKGRGMRRMELAEPLDDELLYG
jgi:hypothetical protein